MTVPAVCPSCGAKFALEAALQDARAREALRQALRIQPELADLVVSYLAMFSPDNRRAIRMDKLTSLLTELSEAIRSAQVERNGRSWAAPFELWKEALGQVVAKRDDAKLSLPLTTHGLLFKIVADMASQHEGRHEINRERERVHDQGPRHGAPVDVKGTMPEHLKGGGWRSALRKPE